MEATVTTEHLTSDIVTRALNKVTLRQGGWPFGKTAPCQVHDALVTIIENMLTNVEKLRKQKAIVVFEAEGEQAYDFASELMDEIGKECLVVAEHLEVVRKGTA